MTNICQWRGDTLFSTALYNLTTRSRERESPCLASGVCASFEMERCSRALSRSPLMGFLILLLGAVRTCCRLHRNTGHDSMAMARGRGVVTPGALTSRDITLMRISLYYRRARRESRWKLFSQYGRRIAVRESSRERVRRQRTASCDADVSLDASTDALFVHSSYYSRVIA